MCHFYIMLSCEQALDQNETLRNRLQRIHNESELPALADQFKSSVTSPLQIQTPGMDSCNGVDLVSMIR